MGWSRILDWSLDRMADSQAEESLLNLFLRWCNQVPCTGSYMKWASYCCS